MVSHKKLLHKKILTYSKAKKHLSCLCEKITTLEIFFYFLKLISLDLIDLGDFLCS